MPAATDAAGTANAGGLVGAGSPTATNSYWDIDSSDIATTTTDTAIAGKTTLALQERLR